MLLSKWASDYWTFAVRQFGWSVYYVGKKTDHTQHLSFFFFRWEIPSSSKAGAKSQKAKGLLGLGTSSGGPQVSARPSPPPATPRTGGRGRPARAAPHVNVADAWAHVPTSSAVLRLPKPEAKTYDGSFFSKAVLVPTKNTVAEKYCSILYYFLFFW